MARPILASIGLLFGLLSAPTGVAAADTHFAPTWLYPLLPSAPATRPPFDDSKPIHIAYSDVSYTEAGLNNLYSAPDWFPASHGAMPEVVSHGRNPGVYACVRVVETARVPRARVVGWVYAAISGTDAGDEPLDGRLMEFTPDPERHEHRDDNLVYTAYVPSGSVARGRLRARGGGQSLATPCIACHGNHLEGTAVIPRLAGRSPTYLLRQLIAFKGGTRAGTTDAPMRAVVLDMQLADMIDVAAYAASLGSP